MKKVLVVADPTEAGPRLEGLIKFLPRYGWQPHLLTNRKPVRVGRKAGRQFFRKFRTFRPFVQYAMQRYRELAYYPDSTRRYQKQMVQQGRKAVENVDAIFSSSSPATCHVVASQLKQHTNILWVADFRDLWTQNHNYPYTSIRKRVESKLEHKTLAQADRLTTVSDPLAEKLSMFHRKPTCTITNGYDPDTVSSTPLTNKFTVTYTGQIYSQQDVSKPLMALAKLISKGNIEREDVKVRFYGKQNRRIVDLTRSLNLEDVVEQHGVVSHTEALMRQRESQVLLLLKWEDPAERGVYTTKVFEYLAAERPILATGGVNDVVSDLLSQTNGGVDCHSINACMQAFAQFYSEWKEQHETCYHGRLTEVSKYSFVEMARKFSDVLTVN